MSGSSDYTLTTNLQLFKPIYNMDAEQWGAHLNSNADKLDAQFSGGAGAVFLPTAGGTMTGPVVLAGINTAPTPVPSTANTQLATTAFVRTGTVTNDNAGAGQVGQYVSATVLAGAAVPLTTGVVANVTSISLTAGDWDVQAAVGFIPSVAASTLTSGISTTSAALPAPPVGGSISLGLSTAAFVGGQYLPLGGNRLSLAATTTVYLVASANFASGTCGAHGFIGARRRR